MNEQATNEQPVTCTVSWDDRHHFDEIIAHLESVGHALNNEVCNLSSHRPPDRDQQSSLHVSVQLLLRLVDELEAIGKAG